MSSGTGLHARKKGALQDPEDPDQKDESPPSGGVRLRRRSRLLPLYLYRSEVGCALEMVVCFLLGGLFIGYFILHHQHRKVALQIMSNPMAHAGAALNACVLISEFTNLSSEFANLSSQHLSVNTKTKYFLTMD